MAWGIWAIIAAVLFIVEMLTVDFTFIMIAGGALAATAVSAVGGNLVLQIAAFAVVTTLLLFFVRPWAREHINNSAAGESNIYALTGRIATTLTPVDAFNGRVKVGGDVWSARSAEGEIGSGQNVIIQSVDGAQLVVSPQ